jgi:hypothetical protein
LIGQRKSFTRGHEVEAPAGPQRRHAFAKSGGQLGRKRAFDFNGVDSPVGMFKDKIDLSSSMRPVMAGAGSRRQQAQDLFNAIAFPRMAADRMAEDAGSFTMKSRNPIPDFQGKTFNRRF